MEEFVVFVFVLFCFVTNLSMVQCGSLAPGPTLPTPFSEHAARLKPTPPKLRPPRRGKPNEAVLDNMSPVCQHADRCNRAQELLNLVARRHPEAVARKEPGSPVAIVVGAGPAGLRAAIELAPSHLVIVYDKYPKPCRARFLGLFSRERDYLDRLGLTTKESTYFPDGKETKRGILSADLDLGMMYVAKKMGVVVCRGHEVVKLADSAASEPSGEISRTLEIDSRRSVEHSDALCALPPPFDVLVWAGGSRNHQLDRRTEPDFPARYLKSPVVPMGEIARRGLLFGWAKQLKAQAEARTLGAEEIEFVNDSEALLAKNEFDAVATLRLLQDAVEKGVINRMDKDTLRSILYESNEPWVRAEEAKANAEEIYTGAFEDVKSFASLENRRFVVKFWELIFASAASKLRLSGSFFVSNIAPTFLPTYKASEIKRAECASLQATLVPDWLFLNLGVREESKEEAKGKTQVKRVHWEGPLPHKLFQSFKKKLMERYTGFDNVMRLYNRITYALMTVLAQRINAGGVSWDEYLKENGDDQDGGTRSASFFESNFAASVRTHGRIEITDMIVSPPRRYKVQRWVIVGDAAQDAWYRFGLGVHDAFSSVDDAIRFLREDTVGRAAPGNIYTSHRNFQALRALQISHAVFAGQYAFENGEKYGSFATKWLSAAEKVVDRLMRSAVSAPSVASPVTESKGAVQATVPISDTVSFPAAQRGAHRAHRRFHKGMPRTQKSKKTEAQIAKSAKLRLLEEALFAD